MPDVSAPNPRSLWYARLGAGRSSHVVAPAEPLAFHPLRPWESLALRPTRDVEAMRRTLSTGRIARSPNTRAITEGVNKELIERVVIVNRRSGKRLTALIKPVAAGGAQEVFAYEVARAVRMDHLLPAVGRRADGAAAIEFRPGVTWGDASIYTSKELELAMRHAHANRDPFAPADEIARRAFVERQLAQVFDYLIANGDRHLENGLFDARRGTVSLIDHGLLDRWETSGGIPRVMMDYQGGAGAILGADRITTMKLSDEVIALLRRTDRDHIERAFSQMMRDQRGATSVGKYATKTDPTFLGQLMGRLDDAIRLGVIRVRP